MFIYIADCIFAMQVYAVVYLPIKTGRYSAVWSGSSTLIDAFNEVLGNKMQVLSVNEFQEVAGADAPFGCSNSMTSSQYSSAAGFWGGVGMMGAAFSGTGLGFGVAAAGGAMYAYNSYCSW